MIGCLVAFIGVWLATMVGFLTGRIADWHTTEQIGSERSTRTEHLTRRQQMAWGLAMLAVTAAVVAWAITSRFFRDVAAASRVASAAYSTLDGVAFLWLAQFLSRHRRPGSLKPSDKVDEPEPPETDLELTGTGLLNQGLGYVSTSLMRSRQGRSVMAAFTAAMGVVCLLLGLVIAVTGSTIPTQAFLRFYEAMDSLDWLVFLLVLPVLMLGIVIAFIVRVVQMKAWALQRAAMLAALLACTGLLIGVLGRLGLIAGYSEAVSKNFHALTP